MTATIQITAPIAEGEYFRWPLLAIGQGVIVSLRAFFLHKSSKAMPVKNKQLNPPQSKFDFNAAGRGSKRAVERIVLNSNSKLARYLWRRRACETEN